MMQLRWYQQEACEATWQALTSGKGNPLIDLPTGSGKSLVLAELARKAVTDYAGRVVILAHRKELLEQNAGKLAALCDINTGIYSAGLNSRDVEQPVIVGGIQSIYNKAHELGRRHLVLIDECFVGETIILTPNGPRRLDNIRCGDIVYNANGVGYVQAISCRPSSHILEVELSDGTITRCTDNHPWFTDAGWVKARALGVGAVTYGIEELRSLWQGVPSLAETEQGGADEGIQRIGLERAKMLLTILCKEIQKPDEQQSSSIEDAGKNQRVAIQAYQAWRKRAVTVFSTSCAAACAWGGVGGGGSCSDRLQPGNGSRHVPNVLQAGHSEQGKEDRDRGGRRLTHNIRATGTGCKEVGVAGVVRVVRVSRIKREGLAPVFNLQVSGHPSYFANGRLVHNCHLTPMSDDGMYRTFLADLERYNPKLKIVGLTATPYRLDSGRLWGPGELFSHVCYRADIRKLIEEGHLSNLVNKPSSTQYDTSGLHTRAGEFIGREVADLFGDDYLMRQACAELVAKTQDRKSIIVFCAGVEHAEQVAKVLSDMTGERCDVITGETPKLMREESLDTFGHGGFRFLCNVDVLTTGFDSPRIDCVAIMRATQSAGLFCQMVGRGLRTFPGKADALIVDFGGNLKRHGPIDAVDFGKQSSRGGTGEAPTKYCPSCEEQVAAGTRICGCGFAFTFKKAEHEQTSDEESKVLSEPETMEVAYWTLTRHKKKDNPDAPNTLRVSYCAPGDLGKVVEEWVCLNHEGFAGNKARAWWREHSDENIDEVAEVLELDRVGAAMHIEERGYVRRPVQITYVRDGKFYRVIGRVLGELVRVEEEELPF